MSVLMFDIILSLAFILVYYLIFVSPATKRSDKLVHDLSYANPYSGPFTASFDKNEIRAAGQTWHVPIDPNLYTWTSDGVLKPVHPCDNEPDGSLLKVNDLSALPPNTVPAISPSSHNSNNHDPLDYHDFEIDYYFECRKNAESVLYHCPPGTRFVNGKCTGTEICQLKPDGFKYPVAGRETQYFQCENKTAVRKNCPPNEIFVDNECRKPKDPCHLKPDGHILGFDRASFKICRRGVTNVNYCRPEDEYFHPKTLQCVPSVCENVGDDSVAKDRVTDGIWNYSPGYTACKNGLVVAEENCSGQEQHETLNEEMELPRFKVFDPQTKQCSAPRLCRNIFPSGLSVPATKYTRGMANYKHSHLYDKLHGYRCQSSAVEHYIAPPGRLYDGSSVCDYDKTLQKYPVYGQWDQHYDCVSQTVVPSSALKTTTYDHEGQINVDIDDSFHRMDNGHPIFKLDNLYHAWIRPRNVRRQPDAANCTGSQIYDSTYNVCVDSECRGLGFLRQIPGSKIIANESHVCSYDKQAAAVRYEPYRKPAGLKLDYWRQKFVDVAVAPCVLNATRLETSDFVMNAAVRPTCTRNSPFILCPSGLTEKITQADSKVLDSPLVCVPKTTELKLEPHVWYKVYNYQTAYVIFPEDNATIETRDGQRYVNAKKSSRWFLPLSLDPETEFKADKPGILYKTNLPTNHPEYVVNEKKEILHKAMDGPSPIRPPGTAKFHFVDYRFEQMLRGFNFEA